MKSEEALIAVLVGLMNLSLLESNVLPTNEYKEIMKRLSYTFGLNLLKCGDELKATQLMEQDIYNYWNKEYKLAYVSTGCLMLCTMNKLELLDEQGQLQRANAKGYVRAGGADDQMVSQLISLYDDCRDVPKTIKTPCAVAFEVAKCYKQGIQDLNWTPDISSLTALK